MFHQESERCLFSKSKETLSTNNYFLKISVFLTVLLEEQWVDNNNLEVKAFIWKTLNTNTNTTLPNLEVD